MGLSLWTQSVFLSWSWQIVLPGLALYVAIQYILFRGSIWKKRKLPPGVPGCPGLGILPGLAFGKRKLRDVLRDYENTHGQIFR